MPLVSAKCTFCKEQIKLDDTKESGVCPYCGRRVLVQQAVEIPLTTEQWVQKGKEYYENQDYDNAIIAFTQAIALNPQLAEAYYRRSGAYLGKDQTGSCHRRLYTSYRFKSAV